MIDEVVDDDDDDDDGNINDNKGDSTSPGVGKARRRPLSGGYNYG